MCLEWEMSHPHPDLALDPFELTGRARTHVVELTEPRCVLHRAAVQPFLAMRAAAAAAGIDLVPASSFRDFDRQLAIWNGKFRGERPLNGRDGLPVAAASLDEAARVDVILAWSALPGASRHHWGTEIDVVDGTRLVPGQPVPLEPAEFAPGGRFASLDRWLNGHMADYGFHRPYVENRGGVQPEPWHLSFAPVAARALAAFSPQLLHDALAGSGIEGWGLLAPQLPQLYARYVTNVEAVPHDALLARAVRTVSSPSSPS